jgi:hypothetical protein
MNMKIGKLEINGRTGLAFARAAAIFALLLTPGSRCEGGIPEPDLVWYGKVLTSSGGIAVRVTGGTLTWQIEPVAGGTPWTLSTPLTNLNDQFSFLLRVPCETPELGVTATPGTVGPLPTGSTASNNPNASWGANTLKNVCAICDANHNQKSAAEANLTAIPLTAYQVRITITPAIRGPEGTDHETE